MASDMQPPLRPTSKIRLLLVDDSPLIRRSLRLLLESQLDLEIIGEAADGEHAVRLAHSLRPDVILMDIRMPVMDGLTATRLLAIQLPALRVIVISTYDGVEIEEAAAAAGAVAFVSKSTRAPDLFRAIRQAV